MSTPRPDWAHDFSDKKRSICNSHYSQKTDCGRCPLRPACHRPTGPGKDAFNDWICRINNLAESIK